MSKLHAIANTFGFALALTLPTLPIPAWADTLTYFGDGVDSEDVSDLLSTVGIENNFATETTAESFLVPGTTGTTELTFTFVVDLGAYQFNFGFFPLASVAGIDPITQKQDWATAALSAATPVFDDLSQDPVVSSSFTLNAGSELGFFLIPDNTITNFLANPSAFFPSQTADSAFRSPLFSVSDANPGEFDQLLSFVSNGITLFTFEDLTRAGDSDLSFTDLSFTVDAELAPVVQPVPEPDSFIGLLGLSLILIAGWGRAARKRIQG